MKLCVGTYFTQRWTYSVRSWLEHIAPALRGFSGNLILSTDATSECANLVKAVAQRLPNWGVVHLQNEVKNDNMRPYGEEAQLIIARLQQAALVRARELDATHYWSVESDVLVPPNALRVSIQALEFDEGYYDVAMVSYPNGQFLGGRGTPERHICENVYEDERVIPKPLALKVKRLKALIKKAPTKENVSELQKAMKEIELCPPRENIFGRQSKKWRKRGWLEDAYPGVGRGAILPTDWVGLGCTLLSGKALDLSNFDGYSLGGTQDLYLCWQKWHPAGLQMCVIPHVLCSHVKRRITDDGSARTDEITIQLASHASGEFEGHPRWHEVKYIDYLGSPAPIADSCSKSG